MNADGIRNNTFSTIPNNVQVSRTGELVIGIIVS
jgi:hypothetical protein